MNPPADATPNPADQLPSSPAVPQPGAPQAGPMSVDEAMSYFAPGRNPEDAPAEAFSIWKSQVGPVNMAAVAQQIGREDSPRTGYDLESPIALAPVPPPGGNQLPPVPQQPQQQPDPDPAAAPPQAPPVLSQAEQFQKLCEQGVNHAAAYRAIYGGTPAGQAPQTQQPEPQAPAVPPSQARLDALDAQIELEREKLDNPEKFPEFSYGDGATNKQHVLVQRLSQQRQDLMLQVWREEQQIQHDNTVAAQAAQDADWRAAMNLLPGLKDQNSQAYKLLASTIEQMNQTESGRIYLMTPGAYTRLATDLRTAHPALSATPPPAPSRFPVPPQTPVAQYQPGTTPGGAPPAMAPPRAMTPDELEKFSERNPEAYRQMKQTVLTQVPARGRL